MIILREIAKANKAATTFDNSVFLSSHDDASALAGTNGCGGRGVTPYLFNRIFC